MTVGEMRSLEGLRLGRQAKALIERIEQLELDMSAHEGGSGLAAISDFADSPARFARDVLHFAPHPWQELVLSEQGRRLLLLCCRQAGKSITTASAAIHLAATKARCRVVVVAPGARQSRLFVERCATMLRDSLLWRDVDIQQTQIKFANGSIIRAFPGNPDTIRGESADLLILDEAAMMTDELFTAIMPMIAATAGKVVILSTPKGQRGFFYRLWSESDNGWTKIRVTADDAPSLSEEEISRLKAELPAYAVRQELYCDFLSGTEGVFTAQDILATLESPVEGLWSPNCASALAGDKIDEVRLLNPRGQARNLPRQVVIGLDLGLHPDWTALVVAVTHWDSERKQQIIEVPVIERIRDTSYSAIRQRLMHLDRIIRLGCHVSPFMIIDASGGGHDFSEQLRALGVRHFAGTISHTTGKRCGYKWTIGKADLVYRLQTAFQDRTLRLNRDALAAIEMVDELSSFSVKLSETGWLSYEGRNNHDDLVVALALSVWMVEKMIAPRPRTVRISGY